MLLDRRDTGKSTGEGERNRASSLTAWRLAERSKFFRLRNVTIQSVMLSALCRTISASLMSAFDTSSRLLPRANSSSTKSTTSSCVITSHNPSQARMRKRSSSSRVRRYTSGSAIRPDGFPQVNSGCLYIRSPIERDTARLKKAEFRCGWPTRLLYRRPPASVIRLISSGLRCGLCTLVMDSGHSARHSTASESPMLPINNSRPSTNRPTTAVDPSSSCFSVANFKNFSSDTSRASISARLGSSLNMGFSRRMWWAHLAK
mmetsp:Transcript_9190/g.23027  ORF Transcript_9190/g.23027 Transcript_9190/m.23027 type:complete len:260 (+) Transcript_9190:1412-2191(+)